MRPAGVPVSIVISGSAAPGLPACVDAAAAAAPAAELIVVDPPDHALESIHAAGALVAYADGAAVLGANQAAEVASAPVLLFVDASARLDAAAVDALVAAFGDTRTGIAGPQLIGPDGTVAAAGWLVSDEGTVTPFAAGAAPVDRRVQRRCSVDAIDRACLAVRTTTWQALRGFDARYSEAGYEDIDLCFAARSVGWDVVYVPDACVRLVEARPAERHGRERFVARWEEALAHQEPAELQGAVADRALRWVNVTARPARPPGAGTVVVVAAGETRADGRRGTEIREGFAEVRAVADTIDSSTAVAWLVGVEAFEATFPSVRATAPEAVVVCDLPNPSGSARERWCVRLADVVASTTAAAGGEIVVPWVARPGAMASPAQRSGIVVAVDGARADDREAVLWLCREIVPRVGAPLTLVGDRDDPGLRALAGGRVDLLSADDWPLALRRARVAVAPWRSGTGMHRWAVEALAAGVPLVATPEGAAGLGLDEEWVATTADGLAGCISDLLLDNERWMRASIAGQDLVRDAGLTPAGLARRLAAWSAG